MLKQKQMLIALAIITTVFIISISILISGLTDRDNELDKATAKIERLNKEVKHQSDVEILGYKANESKIISDDTLETINEYKELIKDLEIKYETNVLKTRCNKDQINRMINNLEYNTEYCEGENLLQFKESKKY